MKRFQNILVSVDSVFDNHRALQWAARVAEHNRAKLKIVDVLCDMPWIAKRAIPDYESIQHALAEKKRCKIESIAGPIREKGIDVTTQVLSGKTSFAIIHEILRAGHDLVVRVTKGAHSRRTGVFGTTSMRLLRKCPCAVWLVRADVPARFARVLAAVDPEPLDLPRDMMNNTVMELAKSIADYEQGELHVVHSWELFASHLLKSRYKRGEFEEAKRRAETNAAGAMDDFLSPYGLSHRSSRVHLLCGESGPGHAIVQLAKREQIDLVVMGTIARTGLKGALMGNTAEQVLDHIECAVLATKPDQFISPVTLPEA